MAEFALTGSRMVAEATTFRLTDARMVGGSPLSFSLTRARMTTDGAMTTVEAGLPLTTDPFELVALVALVGGSPDTVTWTLDSGTNGTNPTVIGSGSSVTYWAPSAVNGTVLTWLVTAVTAGQPTQTDTVVHTVRPHAGPWMVTGTDYINGPGRTPVKMSALQLTP